jgi:hypothetical protein
VQICLAELYLNLLNKKQLIDKISNIASLKSSFLQFISSTENKSKIESISTSNNVQQAMEPILEEFYLKYAI